MQWLASWTLSLLSPSPCISHCHLHLHLHLLDNKGNSKRGKKGTKNATPGPAAGLPPFGVQDDGSGTIPSHAMQGWRQQDNLKLPNVVYDLPPVDFITLVVTELGMIPPTSVPVIIREQSQKW